MRKVLAVNRMKIPSVGHLKHYDTKLPYIAYVRFQSAGGYGSHANRAYKPIEFFDLLNSGAIQEITMIQSYIGTRGTQPSIYYRLNDEIRHKKKLAKIERYRQHDQKVKDFYKAK